MPAQPGLLRAHASIASAASAIGIRSQLIVAPKITVGASATIAASHGRCRTVSAVATTAMSKNASSPITLTSKNATIGSAPSTPAIGLATNDAIHMNTPVSTGYSSG